MNQEDNPNQPLRPSYPYKPEHFREIEERKIKQAMKNLKNKNVKIVDVNDGPFIPISYKGDKKSGRK